MILHKYCSMSDKNLNYTKKIILDQEVFFNKPTEFNDPYDCYPSLIFSGTEDDELEWCEKKTQESHPNMSLEEVRVVAKKRFASGLGLKEILKTTNVWKAGGDRLKIFCLTQEPANILMWSHYADQHKGICLGFDCTPNKATFGTARKVDYDQPRPILEFLEILKEDNNELEWSAFVKAKDWEYEEEWRIAVNDIDHIVNYKPGELKQIILGAKISASHLDDILLWRNKLEHKPDLFKAELHQDQYKINLSPF